jgi:hypothetical protein
MAKNDNIRNVSGLSADQLMRRFGHGVLLEYGGIAIKVEAVMLATAQHYIDDIPTEERHKVIASVSATLEALNDALASGNFTEEEADIFVTDLCLWEALRRYAT